MRDFDQGFIFIDDQPPATEAQLDRLKQCVEEELKKLSGG